MSRRVTRNDAIVISRSVMNLRDQRRLRNRQPLPSARSHRAIVERNGKQFLTEYRERAEKRYVQCFDETTGQLRLFEVVDYIPSRVVQPMRYPSQSRLSHYTSQHSLMNPLQSNPNLVRPAASVDQLQSGMLSPLGDTTNSSESSLPKLIVDRENDSASFLPLRRKRDCRIEQRLSSARTCTNGQ